MSVYLREKSLKEENMANFKICGPYKVKLTSVTSSYWRLSSEQRNLWKKTHQEVKNGCCKKKGCYIYTNSKKTPIYVGKTDNSFGQECFKDHKQYLINDYLKEHKLQNWCLYIYFIYFTGKNTTCINKEIDTLESNLIRKAFHVNKKLLNTKKLNFRYNIIDEENILENAIFTKKRRIQQKCKTKV